MLRLDKYFYLTPLLFIIHFTRSQAYVEWIDNPFYISLASRKVS
ncbi:hypothetical protein FH603_4369 [Spirosoma sp. LMG 31447]|uniref:Uncharacterized protein n=1 Tax=Spirosoma utsteinense TaxID=2585773 RepID=A0ABR6WBA3_9BACT|nr:hypothetical protein [Spirosoma utsteinense]